jgi:hypothetical protein
MINQQMDIYFVQKDFQTKQYKRYDNGNIVAQKIGTIFPPGQYGYPTAPNMKVDFTPTKSGEWIILPKGVKPGEEMQQGMGQPQGQQQNNYQQQSNHISNSMPNTQQGDPGPSGQNW